MKKVVVRVGSITGNKIRYEQYDGAIFMARINGEGRACYEGTTGATRWRDATASEAEAYNRGVTNIKYMHNSNERTLNHSIC